MFRKKARHDPITTGDPFTDFLGRLMDSTDYRNEFRADPRETARRAGVELSEEDLRTLEAQFGDEAHYQDIIHGRA